MVVIALSGVVQFLGAPGSSVEVSRAHVLVIPCGNWHQISNEGTVDSQVLHFFAGVGSVDDIGYENRPWVCPLMPTPQKPSSVIALFGFHDHSIRVLGGQRRQCVEPGRLARNDFGAAVVDRPTEVGGLLDVTCWVPGARDRHDLHVDARVVHDP
ncbi:MAG: hypothetical protein ACREJT_16675 [Myxococcota bacterium]